MADCFIFDAVRSPRGRGRPDGGLHTLTSVDLAAQMLLAISHRNGLELSRLDDVVLGCVDPVGEAGADIARAAVLKAGFPDCVPGIQINRFCASGLDAVNFAAAAIMAGAHDLAIGGGVEMMSRIPLGAAGGAWPTDPSVALPLAYVPQGVSADLIATRYGFARAALDAYAVESQARAAASWQAGAFARSIIPARDLNGTVLLDHDEHMRPGTTLETLATLKPAFAEVGMTFGFDAVALARYPELERIEHMHHAGNSSGIVDGAAAVLLGSAEQAQELGLKPRARIRAFANIGTEPAIMLTGPIAVTRKVLARAGMHIDDIDLIEINEAFASVVLHAMHELALDPARVNVAGGAIAFGHPLGATGAMLLGTLLGEMERRDLATGLVTLCIGAGMGTATIIERL